MPLLINKSLTAFSSLSIWTIEETTEDLLRLLKPDNPHIDVSAVHLPLRQRQRLCTLLLLKTVMGNVPEIHYDINGKPYLANTPAHISVSHSGKYVAVIVNRKSDTGIDIQIHSSKIDRIKEKFLHINELEDISGQQKKEEYRNKLHVYWCAKEALYKLHGKGGLVFSRDLFIHPFDLPGMGLKNNGLIQGTIYREGKKNHYSLSYEIKEEYVLVYINP